MNELADNPASPPTGTVPRTGVPPMAGGGEMGKRVRDTDWSTTPLGAFSTWPQSLRSSLSLVLNAKGIAALYWGPEQWLLYNDAYGAALGDRHPEAFGRSMPEVLTDIGPVLGPQVEEVLRTGIGFAIENLAMTMRRNGRDEETVWTYSFSPVQGESGDIAGVLLLATEMTLQRMAERSGEALRMRLETALRVARLGTFDWQTSTGAIEVDARGREMFGLPPDGALTEVDTFGKIASEDVERVKRDAAAFLSTDGPFDIRNVERTFDVHYDVVHADGSRRSIVSSGTIVDDDDGTRRMIGAFDDVTDLKRAEAGLLAQNAALEGRIEERTQERDRIWQLSGDMLGVADDRGVWLSINPAWTRTLGWEPDEIVGRTSEWMEHPDDVAKTRAEIGRLAAGMRTFEFENRFRSKAGDYRNLSWTAVPENGLLYCVTRDVTEERERDAALRLFGNIVESSSAPICAFDTRYRLIAFNQAHSDEFFRIFGYRVQLGEEFPNLFPPDQGHVMRGFMTRALDGEVFTIAHEFGDPNLVRSCFEVSYSPIRDEAGRVVAAFHIAQDISARLTAQAELERTQEALRQSQKMEAVGQLTGGLAHDFNNLLAGISGSLEMMKSRIAQGRIGDLDRYMTGAQEATKRAAALTHRLLAFSRRQTLEPKATDVDRLAAGMEDMIRRTVGPAIAVEFHGLADLWSTLIDPNQLENALLNLCINARDAMPDGGRIAVETGNRTVDARSASDRDMPPGDYVTLSVSDDGVGMPPEVVARVFEPFFTTKPIGVGTGLGLSMIYGFAKQSGGQVRIHSEVGKGTTVTLFLPRHATAEALGVDVGPGTEDRQAKVGETVLVIDDEPLVRMLVVDVLEDLGYRALEAGDGPQGLMLLRSDARIDLLITDVGLPKGMNGRQVADAAREHRPGLKVLFVTGYAETAVLSHGHLDPGMQVITKPFQMEVLAKRIQEMIRGD